MLALLFCFGYSAISTAFVSGTMLRHLLEIGFWLCAGSVLHAYVGYPVFLAIMGRIHTRSIHKHSIAPKVSLVIAAYNEEAVIGEKIENSLELDYPQDRLEIVVCSESNDRTNSIVESYAGKGVVLRAFGERRGKAAMLYDVVPSVSGEIVVFSDANAMYERKAIANLVRNFADSRIGVVSGRLEYVSDAENSVAASESAYWKYEMALKRLESDLFSLLGANGSIFALRKSLYSPLSPTQGDDFELPVRVMLQGYGSVLEPEAVSRELAPTSTRAECKRRARIVSGMFGSASALAWEAIVARRPMILFQILSKRVLRWLGGIFLLGGWIASYFVATPLFRVMFVAQAIFYLVSIAAWSLDGLKVRIPAVFRLPYYFCALNLAGMFGLLRLVMTGNPTRWEKVR